MATLLITFISMLYALLNIYLCAFNYVLFLFENSVDLDAIYPASTQRWPNVEITSLQRRCDVGPA